MLSFDVARVCTGSPDTAVRRGRVRARGGRRGLRSALEGYAVTRDDCVDIHTYCVARGATAMPGPYEMALGGPTPQRADKA